MPRRWAFTGLLLYPLKETLREYLSRPSVFWGQILVSSALAAQRKQNYPLRPQTTSDRAYFLASLRNGSVDSKDFRALPGKERGGWRPPPSASRSLLQFLPSLSTWQTTGTFDKGCLVLELSCGRSVTQIDKPPTGCSFLLWREHDPRRKEWIIVKRLFLYLIQNLRLFVNSFKKVTSRQMNQSSARIRSRCFGNSHCWAGCLSLPLPFPSHAQAFGGRVEILQAELIKSVRALELSDFGKRAYPRWTPMILLVMGCAQFLNAKSACEDHQGAQREGLPELRGLPKPSTRLATRRAQLPLHRGPGRL